MLYSLGQLLYFNLKKKKIKRKDIKSNLCICCKDHVKIDFSGIASDASGGCRRELGFSYIYIYTHTQTRYLYLVSFQVFLGKFSMFVKMVGVIHGPERDKREYYYTVTPLHRCH